MNAPTFGAAPIPHDARDGPAPPQWTRCGGCGRIAEAYVALNGETRVRCLTCRSDRVMPRRVPNAADRAAADARGPYKLRRPRTPAASLPSLTPPEGAITGPPLPSRAPTVAPRQPEAPCDA